MNNTISEAEDLIWELNKAIKDPIPNVKILVCPAFVNLLKVREIASGTPIHIGAQNCYTEQKGAFTGEISVNMLKAVGCEYIIVGHSERRTLFAESNEFINKKVKLILERGMFPILCIGETLEQRKAGNTTQVLKEQLDACLEGIDPDDVRQIVIAYEPVWAIGTGVSATIEEVKEAHS
jgi:triosephosphate isomerase